MLSIQIFKESNKIRCSKINFSFQSLHIIPCVEFCKCMIINHKSHDKKIMAISYSYLPSVNSIYVPSNIKTSIQSVSLCPYNTIKYSSNRRDFPLPAVASTSYPQIDVDGVAFSDIGDSCIVRIALENGSSASLMLPSGLITSFKVPMWHGGSMELLHISISNGADDAVLIQGGLSFAFSCENEAGVSRSPGAWNLHQVKGTPRDSIQVELINSNSLGGNEVEVRHIITLGQDLLTSEIVVSNWSTSSLRIMGSVISHLAVSTPDATYAIGLQGSDFFIRPPVVANFSIMPPDCTKRKGQDTSYFSAFSKLFPNWVAKNQNTAADDDVASQVKDKEELDALEEENYKHLTQKISRIYTNAPRNLTIIDRGKRNSVIVRREGFNELYLFSPGSGHEWYSQYSYICIGHAALLEPIILKSQSEWRGSLCLWNPNT